MTTPTLTPDELIQALFANLAKLAAIDERITPFTVMEFQASVGLPAVGYTRAHNALRALHDAGLLHQTHRSAVYALRHDLPTSGNGHVWLRINNRGGAPVEVIADRPRPTDKPATDHELIRWTCHGCGHGHQSGVYSDATQLVEEHAENCRAQHLNA